MHLTTRSISGTLVALGMLVVAIQLPGATPVEARQVTAPAADRGATLFRQRCGACHSVTPGINSPQGPHLGGVVGRRSASVAGYAYSRGMQNANRTWTTTTLDAFLAAPTRAVPGTRMMTSVANPADRAAIVAYLATRRQPR